MFAPCPANRYQVAHAELLRRSFHALTGCDLLDPTLAPEAAADALFHAPFVVLSHDAAPDPILTYGNRQALELFELSWEALIQMPSRLTAEAPDRAERARLLAEVAARGFIDDYSGVRISRAGRRFMIARATVWNLTDAAGRLCGQAAMFRDWRDLEDAEAGRQSPGPPD
ncbi:MAG: MEKHLA domain-containing protein [Candidatus Competibacteraceae bacterium]